ncbi:hypothetical protein FDUTEX481_07087 [Tolypothrix sp. PCC 7601]|nr:hypothetical protein FDUTEX481_07087 [Tolypothrix sp. PCC 7601]
MRPLFCCLSFVIGHLSLVLCDSNELGDNSFTYRNCSKSDRTPKSRTVIVIAR